MQLSVIKTISGLLNDDERLDGTVLGSLALPDRFFLLYWNGKIGSNEQPIPFLFNRSTVFAGC